MAQPSATVVVKMYLRKGRRNSPKAEEEAYDEPTLEQGYREEPQPMEGPMLEQGKGVRAKEQQRPSVKD
ncbi:hypothetical protein GRJ2_000059200 [Grus japonensis]|uniref:Uncharacterized protein n=1 Tax=Grus japonensis TaxID=30415 RepID=A0ABC9VRU4_GRUJA